MFGKLTEKLHNLTFNLSKKKQLTEENISEAAREIRLALLDADVNYSVASKLIKRIKEKALGEDVLKSVSAGDQFTKIVHDELVNMMGGEESHLHLESYPSVIMMCGLQGQGKTTTCAKLAHYLKEDKQVLLVACDRQRPAAIEQLKVLSEKVGCECFDIEGEKDPVKVAKEGIKKAKKEGFDVAIFDTAGRLHIDDALMKELEKIKKVIDPHETLFVTSAMLGQDAVKTAEQFDSRVSVTGSVLTMLDGNARAGSAISILEVTKKPLKFEGIGENIGDLQLFNPHSMADRILGMGDVINLVKKAEKNLGGDDDDIEKKMRKGDFSYNDYLKQMGRLKKMGSIKGLLKMLPGMSQMGDLDVSDDEFKKLEAMILSMTPRERMGLDELVPARRRRIADGSGRSMDDVNRMVKSFKRLKMMMKKMPKKASLKDLDSLKESLK